MEQNTKAGEIVHTPEVIPALHTQVAVTQVNPRTVIANASEAARALVEAMASKLDKVMMGGKRYIEVDDWQVVARFYNCSITIVSDRFVRFGDAEGFEATAALLDRDGHEIGRATMMCLNDEDKWSTRPKYEYLYCLKGTGPDDDCTKHDHAREDEAKGRMVWIQNPNKPDRKMPKKKKEQTGLEKIPLFQLRSMAQTRAAGKVCRLNFGFVPALANYSSTPAEELENAELERDMDARDEEDKRSQSPASSGGASSMTEEQQRRVAEIEARQRRNRGEGDEKPAEKPTEKAPAKQEATPKAKATEKTADAAEPAKAGPIGIVKPAETTDPVAAQEPTTGEASGGTAAVVIDLRVQSKGTSPKGPWSLYMVKFDRKVAAKDGTLVDSATTLDEAVAHALNDAIKKDPVTLLIVPGARRGVYNVAKVGDVTAKDYVG